MKLDPAAQEKRCTVCQGANQNCDKHLETLIKKIADLKFEYENFKITFSISIIAYIRKILVISEAEESLGKTFRYSSKDI